MSTYYVAQGERVTGPFVESQLMAMWAAGGITADAQVMMEGSEVWVPVLDEVRAIEALAPKVKQQVSAERAKPVRSGGSFLEAIKIMLVVGVVIAALSMFANHQSRGTVSQDQSRGLSSIKTWMRTNLADGQARLVAMSGIMKVGDSELRKVRIASLNKFGGPVMENLMFELSGHVVIDAITGDEFVPWLESKASKLTAAEALKLRSEARALAGAVMVSQ